MARGDETHLEIAKDNTEKAVGAMGDAILAALAEIGMSCERFAKKTCPVDTGRLRNSITWQLASDEKAVYIGTNVEYAIYVHEGLGTNRGKGPRPFLKNAAANHTKYYDDIMAKHVGDALK